MDWYLAALKKYAVFTGRARRAEYWYFALYSGLITLGLGIIDYLLGIRLLTGLYSLGVLIPSLAVGVRRLHDTDRSGWWLLISLVPLIGTIVIIVFLAQEGQPNPNRYGADPKLASA